MTIYVTDKEYKTLRRMVRRNVYQNMKRYDRRLDAFTRKFERVFKGIGDILGFLMLAAGAITLMLGTACADSISTEALNLWGFVMICSVVVMAAGAMILDWMRH